LSGYIIQASRDMTRSFVAWGPPLAHKKKKKTKKQKKKKKKKNKKKKQKELLCHRHPASKSALLIDARLRRTIRLVL